MKDLMKKIENITQQLRATEKELKSLLSNELIGPEARYAAILRTQTEDAKLWALYLQTKLKERGDYIG